jgi:hypothetical protein
MCAILIWDNGPNAITIQLSLFSLCCFICISLDAKYLKNADARRVWEGGVRIDCR